MKSFVVKIICGFFISVLIGIYIRSDDKKVVYYFMSADKPKREITREEYISISKGSRWDDYQEGSENLSKEEVYSNNKAMMYGISSFAGLMILISLFELRKKKT
jgi:hypothetical protein